MYIPMPNRVNLGAIPAWTANATNFNGTTTQLFRNSNLTGVVDSAEGCLSFWFNIDGGDDALMEMFVATSNRLFVRRQASNVLRLFAFGSASSILDGETTNTFTTAANTGWNHFYMSWNYTATGAVTVKINGVTETMSWTTDPSSKSAEAVDLSAATAWGVGNTGAGGSRFYGDLADVYFKHDGIVPYEMFVDANGKPANLDYLGKPVLKMTETFATFEVNSGTGGDMSTHINMTAATTSPSD